MTAATSTPIPGITNSQMKDDVTILAAIRRSREEYWSNRSADNGPARQSLTPRSTTSDAIVLELLRLREWQDDSLTEKANVEGYDNGVRHLQQGNYDAAIAEFSTCLRCRGLSESAFTMLGITYMEQGELLTADQYLPEVAYDIQDNEPRCGAVLTYQGLLTFGLEDKDRIEEILGSWQYADSGFEAYLASIQTLIYGNSQPCNNEEADTWRAVESHIRVICGYRDVPLQPLFAGGAMLEFDCLEKAVDLLTAAIRTHGTLEEPWFLRSMAYRELGAADAAAADLETAERIAPGIAAEADGWWQKWQARLDRRRHPLHPWKSSDGRIVVPENISVIQSAG